MSWARARKPTRIEDLAYCLRGIFDIIMPMLYGEGTEAFRRLQREQKIIAYFLGLTPGRCPKLVSSPSLPTSLLRSIRNSGNEDIIAFKRGSFSPSCFSVMCIDDYRKLTPVNLHIQLLAIITGDRAPYDPSMFTSSGSRLKPLWENLT